MEEINHEYYVSLEVAKLLKQLGFDWGCREYYPTSFIACRYEEYAKPTLDVAQRWLRETQGIEVYIIPFRTNYKFIICYIGEIESDVKYTTYEKAQEAGIKKALKIILEKGE